MFQPQFIAVSFCKKLLKTVASGISEILPTRSAGRTETCRGEAGNPSNVGGSVTYFTSVSYPVQDTGSNTTRDDILSQARGSIRNVPLLSKRLGCLTVLHSGQGRWLLCIPGGEGFVPSLLTRFYLT